VHTFFRPTHRRQVFLFATMLFAVACHVRAATPSISGQPQASVVVGERYDFQPALSHSDGFYRQFHIQNKPTWLAFDKRTGKLSGTPAQGHVGTYSRIVISVSVKKARYTMPAFAITVKRTNAKPTPAASTPVANAAPVILGVPAISGTVGQLYSFKPTVNDKNGDTLTFSIQNKPTWASFDTATGALSGTPATAGQHANVVIRVSDGKSTAALQPFTLNVAPAQLATITVSWEAPTHNIDGSVLNNLAGFHVVYGTSPTALNQKLELPSPDMTRVEIEGLATGTYHFAVIAYTTDGLTSDLSEIAWKNM
jgi:hypothetical protein